MADQDIALRVVARLTREASEEIEIEALPKSQQELVVVDFDKGPGGGRFSKELLHKITNNSVFRWLDVSNLRNGFSVGM